ncbi:MAG: hypothetical protein HON76_19870 [Candidatus Scalindua sp.]|jgi:hypothetical protein|nr:hypothetical protein [Candidatus Scalindua sp.]MBT5305901.1 hypothetical protein [Candidatus Scalindua sp.]MBT6052008.1 hypothetical protein [Candidatus Scalindua sp.]MBT6229145.1 hypothetical protein [Candidatus Scalindua sp.]MBT6564778.1 hypothetical protein [Candidatus Scalindua sp.]
MQTMLETTDIFRGAFYLSKGGKLSEVYLSGGGREIVAFRITGENLPELDEAYRTGKATVNPLDLRESLNHLRDILFRTKRDNERNNKNRRPNHANKQRADRVCKTVQ